MAAQRHHVDDTPVPVLAKGKAKTGRLWTAVRDDRLCEHRDPNDRADLHSAAGAPLATCRTLHVHSEYLTVHGMPKARGPRRYTLIGYDTVTSALRAMAARLPWMDRGGFALRTVSNLGQLAAIRAGFGIGIGQVAVARREPALTRVRPDITLSLFAGRRTPHLKCSLELLPDVLDYFRAKKLDMYRLSSDIAPYKVQSGEYRKWRLLESLNRV